LKRHSAKIGETSTSYHSNISKSFKDNYSKHKRFVIRKELFVHKAINLLPKNSEILDLGCGPGIISCALAEKGFRVTGIDGSSEMIILALSNSSFTNNPLFLQKYIPFDPEELNYQFDAIISSSLLEYLAEYEKTIMLANILLKKKGIFIASIPNKESLYRRLEKFIFLLIKRPLYLNYLNNYYSKDEFISSVIKFGFVCLEYDYFAIKGSIFKLLDKFLPSKFTGNMLICVFVKS
jgi:2-polyprenyl-3-methyl-5-hydroxy-6-metoxy-1,4-benzoquinol methylase